MTDSNAAPARNVASRVLKGAVWLTLARIVVNLIGLASTIIMARLLTPEDFGLVAIASGVLAIASAITSLPLFTVLVQVDVLTKKHLDTAWTISALRGVLITVVLIIIAFPLSKIYSDPRLVYIIIALSSVMLLGGLNSPATVILTRDVQFWQDFVLQISTKSIGFVVGVSVAWWTHSYWALVGGNIAGTLIATLISFVFIKYRPAFNLSEWRLMFGFAYWLTLSQLVNTAGWQSDQLILGWRLGPNSLGQYTVGANIASIPTREATGPIVQTLFPAFSAISENSHQLKFAVDRTQGLLVAMALPLGLGFAAVAHSAVPILLGQKWLPIIPIVQALSCLYGLQTIAFPTQALAMAKRENRALFWRDIVILATGLPPVLLGLFSYGLMGAIWGRVFAGLVHTLINMEMIHRLGGSRIRDQIVHVWRSVVSGIFMVVSIVLIHSRLLPDSINPIVGLIILVGAGAATYVAVHCSLWLSLGRPAGAEHAVFGVLNRVWVTALRSPAKNG